MKIPLSFLLAAMALQQVFAYDPLYVKEYPADGPLKFEIKDEIKSPVYSWPRTLITYPVDFSHAKVKAGQLVLTSGTTGKPEPLQLSGIKQGADGFLSFAQVSFFSDLKPGADLVFQLTSGQPIEAHDTLPASTQKGVIEIDGGALKVRLPTSDFASSATNVPPPILGLNAGSGWCGGGRLVSPVKSVQSLKTTCVESGPLFRTYLLNYSFAQGGVYEATVRIVSGYPFVDLTEKITGLSPEDQAMVEFDWAGLNPSRRMPLNRGWLCPPEGLGIDQPVTLPGIVEEPHWIPHANTIENPATEMVFHLAAYQGNGNRDAVPAISFWEEKPDGQELGFFVPDAKKWNDHQYMVWQPTTRLQVRFRHAGGHLMASYPLIEGTRESGITLHSVVQGEKVIADFRDSYQAAAGKTPKAFVDNGAADYSTLEMRHVLWLRSWYGGLSLDKVKDWVLTVPEGMIPGPVPAVDEISSFRYVHKLNEPADLLDRVLHSSLMTYPLGANVGIDAIGHRNIRPFVQNYLRFSSRFTPEQRRQLDAVLLLSAYVNSDDDLAPSRCCISGTPNIASDGFSVPAELAVLYPKHPLHDEWANQFEKRLQLMGCYYTRPDVPAYDSLGGRWCESLAEYNWAYFDSSEPANTSLLLSDGKNRFANFWMAQRARWLADELSAPIYNPNPMWRQSKEGFSKEQATPPPSPWKPGIDLTSQNGFERQYPAHGAHGSGTGIPINDTLPILAQSLRNYDPLAAEHLFWASAHRTSNEYNDKGDYWQQVALHDIGTNHGTDPHLQSSKYTGHGVILRAGVGTPEELSIHLDQVDQGPNYRWGDNGEGSSGVLYFYAAGQPWTGHERENTGDHEMDDASGFTTFGVVKDGQFHTIGANVLERPLYDLGPAQFGEITARQDHQPYSWPVYKSRSVMLVGTDYFILCDDAIGDTRFAWFTMKDLPFPKLVFLSPLGIRADHWTEVSTHISKGVLRDSERLEVPNVVLVTHKTNDVEMEKMISKPIPYLEKANIRQYAWALPKAAKSGQKQSPQVAPRGVYWVKAPTSHDIVFRDTAEIHYDESDGCFSGTAGVIRNKLDGSTELALFEGTTIGAHGVKLSTPAGSELGVSAVFKDAGGIAGKFVVPKEVQFSIQAPGIVGTTLYIDGAKREAGLNNGVLTTTLPAGRHTWELIPGQPTPLAPAILRTENFKGGAKVIFTPVAGANHYRLETSPDGGKTWKPSTEGTASPIAISGFMNGVKLHVRVIATNPEKASAAGNEYPIYISDKAPESPDGLDLVLSKNQIDLTWGEILGAGEYRLYRRVLGATAWTQLYAGPARAFADHEAPGALPPTELPGRGDNALNLHPGTIYEYAVSAVNGNGESVKSLVQNSDPTSWRNWWPAGEERRFKRQTGFWLPPYVTPEAVPPRHYE